MKPVAEENALAKTLALIHTSPTLTPIFGALCTQHLPGINIFHMVDESLIKDTVRNGRLRRLTIRRLLTLINSAQDSGADAILVTCSSIGSGVRIAQQIFDVPIIRVDEAMAAQAVRQGKRIGVMATISTTLEPTLALLQEKADEAGIPVDLIPSLCDGAFEAVLAGDTATHDRILSEALLKDMAGVDLVVLAQASMARVVQAMPPGTLTMPVLSSPELAVLAARDILN